MDYLLKARDWLLSALARRNILRIPLFRWRLALLRYAELAIPSATAKADHHALLAYYYEEARLFQVDATWHERIAKVYGSGTYPKAREEAMQRHDAMARKFREMAEEHLALPDERARSIGAKLITQIIWYGSVRTPDEPCWRTSASPKTLRPWSRPARPA